MKLAVVAAIALLMQQPTSSVSVRVVDSLRSPLPGIGVRVAEVTNCTTLDTESSAQSAATGADGSVEFFVVSNRAYLVTVDSQGGLEGRRECLDRVGSGVAYSQIELRPDLSAQVTLVLPGIDERSTPRTFGLGDFVGVYADDVGRLYEVNVLDEGIGVAVSLPDGGVLRFRDRVDVTFHGGDGEVSFRVEGSRVVGFSLTRPTVKANKER